MTVTEALQRTNDLLKQNADQISTMHGVLDPRTVEAIRKLQQVAHDAVFTRNAR